MPYVVLSTLTIHHKDVDILLSSRHLGSLSLSAMRGASVMKKSIVHQLDRLNLDEVCEMIADGASLAQIGAKFELSHRVSFPRT